MGRNGAGQSEQTGAETKFSEYILRPGNIGFVRACENTSECATEFAAVKIVDEWIDC